MGEPGLFASTSIYGARIFSFIVVFSPLERLYLGWAGIQYMIIIAKCPNVVLSLL